MRKRLISLCILRTVSLSIGFSSGGSPRNLKMTSMSIFCMPRTLSDVGFAQAIATRLPEESAEMEPAALLAEGKDAKVEAAIALESAVERELGTATAFAGAEAAAARLLGDAAEEELSAAIFFPTEIALDLS